MNLAQDGWSAAALWVMAFWGMLLAFLSGNALANVGDCTAGWIWNPLQYVRLLSSIQASPWAWTSPQMAAMFQESLVEIFGGVAAVVGSTAAMCIGGPSAGAKALSAISHLSGASTAAHMAGILTATDGGVLVHDVKGLSGVQMQPHSVSNDYMLTHSDARAFSGKSVKLDDHKKI